MASKEKSVSYLKKEKQKEIFPGCYLPQDFQNEKPNKKNTQSVQN